MNNITLRVGDTYLNGRKAPRTIISIKNGEAKINALDRNCFKISEKSLIFGIKSGNFTNYRSIQENKLYNIY